MPYDLFVSYSRVDDVDGRVTQLVSRIKADFDSLASRPLVPFFDVSQIRGMEDWRHRILQGLRESRLLLACVSPAYLSSRYCEWEFNEFLKREVALLCPGEGVAPVNFVEAPGWSDSHYDERCPTWVAELRRRQHFDLRRWCEGGEPALGRDTLLARELRELIARLCERVRVRDLAVSSPSNVDAHNPHFIGRLAELRRLRETVALGHLGVLTAVHGLGGIGKTALAVEYAHAFAHEYGGGRWQVRCEGESDLRAAIAGLAPSLKIEYGPDERHDLDRRFERVIGVLGEYAKTRAPHRCLLILDNVDQPTLLEPAQTERLPAAEWLHVIATTRLGEDDLSSPRRDRAFLPVDELPEDDALALVESFQANGRFRDDAEREAAQSVVRLLGGFTLAVESAAVYLGQFADVTCAGFLTRLRSEGLLGLDAAAVQSTAGLRHGEKRLHATIHPIWERLDEVQKLILSFAALFPADYVVLPWIHPLVAERFSEVGEPAAPGYPDPWTNLIQRLFGLRLFQPRTRQLAAPGSLARMHRVTQAVIRTALAPDVVDRLTESLRGQLRIVASDLAEPIRDRTVRYEAEREDAKNELAVIWNLWGAQTRSVRRSRRSIS